METAIASGAARRIPGKRPQSPAAPQIAILEHVLQNAVGRGAGAVPGGVCAQVVDVNETLAVVRGRAYRQLSRHGIVRAAAARTRGAAGAMVRSLRGEGGIPGVGQRVVDVLSEVRQP